MLQRNRVVSSAMILVLALMLNAAGFGQSKVTRAVEPFDPVGFMKGFRIGMSYEEVQALLPKTAEQDALAYITSDESFLLGVDIPGQTMWSASFKFDTLDMPARRPEQLIEFSCSVGSATRSESFEAIVKKVTAAFGDPVQLDGSQERIQQAGWRVSGGSILTLEYSKMPGVIATNVNIEFVIKKSRHRESADSKAIA